MAPPTNFKNKRVEMVGMDFEQDEEDKANRGFNDLI